MMQVCR